MDNEATRLINDEPTKREQTASATQSQSEPSAPNKSKKSSPIAAAAGGFVAGAAVGIGGTAAAINTPEDVQNLEGEAAENADIETPAPEEAILVNDEGVRYAHVDADNFHDAFAQARAQVGPGGVFEYNGRIYGTYLADEWNEMTPQERAEYQNRVNEVAPSHHVQHDTATIADATEHQETTPDVVAVPTDAEMVSAEPVDNEIRVLGVETVQDGDGQVMNVALVECEGDQALLVDVDNNGAIDVLVHDDNGDGQIQETEIHDISEAGLDVADLMQTQAAQEGDVFYTSNDDMPDYVNDADSTMLA